MINFEQNIHTGHVMNTMQDAHNWITRTHDNLVAAGCVQTSDTGQYATPSGDPSTVTTNNQIVGYRIYELNDAYSSEVPFYFKLEFQILSGASAGAFRFGKLNVTVGFQTDGAGTILNSNLTKSLRAFSINNSASFVSNPNARTLTVKGDDYLFHGNELCAGCQSSSNIYDAGHFVLLRSKTNGVVNPSVVTFVYPIIAGSASTQGAMATTLRYTRLIKDQGVSPENTHIFRLPRIRNQQGLLVASEADISEGAMLETTDCLISFRADNSDSPWAEHKLSLDGLTEKTYLHIPTALATSPPAPVTISTIYVCDIADAAEVGVGGIGLLIDE